MVLHRNLTDYSCKNPSNFIHIKITKIMLREFSQEHLPYFSMNSFFNDKLAEIKSTPKFNFRS